MTTLRPLRVWALHLSAKWQWKMWKLSRLERHFPQNPHHPCRSHMHVPLPFSSTRLQRQLSRVQRQRLRSHTRRQRRPSRTRSFARDIRKSRSSGYSSRGVFTATSRSVLPTEIRSHFGSRAISVQVNIVAVSDHVFQWFPFDLLIQVSANQLSLFSCISFVLMAVQVKMQCALHCPARRLYLRMLVLLMVLVTTSMVWAPALEVQRTKNSMPFSQNLYTLKRRSLNFLLSRHGCPVWTYLENTWGFRDSTYRDGTEFQCPHRTYVQVPRHTLLQHQMFPVRQDPGLHSNKLTAPQPRGPMAQGHLMTTETHDEGLILPQAQKMTNHEVPSYFDSLANNTSKELHSGSIPFGQSLICWHVTNLSGFIAKQVPCLSGLFLKHEANVKTL